MITIKIPTFKPKKGIPNKRVFKEKKLVHDYKGVSAFGNKQFYYEYRKAGGVMYWYPYGLILTAFFRKVVKHILLGNKVSTPIGQFSIKRVHNHPGIQRISHAGSNKKFYETGVKETVFRENPYFFSFNFIPNRLKKAMLEYTFFAPRSVYTQIPLHHEILEKCIK